MVGNKYFDALHADGGPIPGGAPLIWRNHAGMGYLPLQDTPYDADYFDKYVGYAETERGKALNAARMALVDEWYPSGSLVDIGIGSGQFMDEAGSYGYDINPTAIELLNKRRRLLDPHFEDVDCATFWDSLEHIVEIADILFHVKQFAFVSLPIFKDLPHVLSSKHFRPDEHCWYFTDAGFEKFMYAHGFKVIAQNTMETDLGREDIGTFVCKRVS